MENMDDAVLDDMLEETFRVIANIELERFFAGKQNYQETVRSFSNTIEKLVEWRVENGITEKSRYYSK